MASINQIERLSIRLGVREHNTDASWVKGYQKRDCHLSGSLREMADEIMSNPDISLDDIEMNIRELLTEAAECLDDAHQEWLSLQLAGRDLVGDINALHCPQDPRPDDLSEGSGHFYGGFHPSYDDDSCLETQCYIEWPNLTIVTDQMAAVLRGEEYKL